MARHWHFLSVPFWVGNGAAFVMLQFVTGQWKRLVPNSWQIVPDAWAVFVHYATFHLPPEPNGFYRIFLVGHVTIVAITGFIRNMNRIWAPMAPALPACTSAWWEWA
jgi:sulfoxide reductase catalytic subunit YedY